MQYYMHILYNSRHGEWQYIRWRTRRRNIGMNDENSTDNIEKFGKMLPIFQISGLFIPDLLPLYLISETAPDKD